MSTLETLKTQIDELSNEYAARFGGFSRVTRDVGEIENILKRSLAHLADAERFAASGVADATDVVGVAKSNVELYQTELEEIKKAKAGGPHVLEFIGLGQNANFVFARYRRHFAGQNRATRDLGLLGEMVEELTKIQNRMKSINDKHREDGFQDDIDLVANNLKLYVSERTEISNARASGTPEEQADILAESANTQFQVYQDHFAGMPRVSRRPQLLQRVIANLQQIRDRMETLRKQGLKADSNTQNIGIVNNNLRMYATEFEEIKKGRKATSIPNLMGHLGEAANNTMEEYRKEFAGKSRVGRDLELLSKMCDQLGEVLRQMSDLGRTEPNEMNTRNMTIVTDNLIMLENEFNEIVEANAPSESAATA